MPAKNKHKNKKKKHGGGSVIADQNSINNNDKSREEKSSNETELDDKPYRIDYSDIYGRYLIASRDLRAGELLITELPLVIGPCVSADAVCLGCYQSVDLSDAQYRCKNCDWPMCGEDCRGIGRSDGHTIEECQLFKSKQSQCAALLKSQAMPSTTKNLYELVLIVRIMLLKKSAPEQYAQVMRMESHIEERRKNHVLWQHYQQNVVDRLRNSWQLDEYCDETELHTICGILDVNCFEIGQCGAKARTLYPSAFLLAHDCRPNTAHTDDPRTFAIYVRTSRAVRHGDAITLSYAYTLQGTLKRRDFMHDGKLFWCQCQRCTDPKELGTDCSGIACEKCTRGTVRSRQPLDQLASWDCDSCSFTLSATDVVRLLDKINNDLEAIDVHDVTGLENFLERYSKILRPNHYLLLSAKYSLCQIYGRIEDYLLDRMSLEDIKRKENYCREFLAVIDVLEPGLTRLRGLIMYELHAAIMVLAQRQLQQNLINRQQFQRTLKEVIKLLRESRNILKLEPPGSNEHEMGLAAEDALNKMGCK